MAWRDVFHHKDSPVTVTTDETKWDGDDLPPSLDYTQFPNDTVPPTFAYLQRETPRPLATLYYTGYPETNRGAGRWYKNRADRLNMSEWHDSPDPVRQSNFLTAGRKIHPFGGDITPLHTALWKALNMHDGFAVGKVHGFWRPQMYAGTQLTSDVRRNILPGQATTFGSQYVVAGDPRIGSVQLASGLSANANNGLDGDPYG